MKSDIKIKYTRPMIAAAAMIFSSVSVIGNA